MKTQEKQAELERQINVDKQKMAELDRLKTNGIAELVNSYTMIGEA